MDYYARTPDNEEIMPIKQWHPSACFIATVKMLLGDLVTVPQLEAAADEQCAWLPDSMKWRQRGGCSFELLRRMGFEPVRSDRIEAFPCIATVKSVNLEDSLHSIVLRKIGNRLEILDPSKKKQVSLEHVMRTCSKTEYLAYRWRRPWTIGLMHPNSPAQYRNYHEIREGRTRHWHAESHGGDDELRRPFSQHWNNLKNLQGDSP